MSAAPTKIFGMNLRVDPKVIVLVLIVLAGAIYYFTSNSDTQGSNTGAAQVGNQPGGIMPAAVRPGVNPTLAARAAAARRANAARNDRGTLKLVPVDGSRGDVDPTLRLGLLERVKTVPAAAGIRNLFDAGNPLMAENLPPVPKNAPKMMPLAQQDAANAAQPPPPPPPPFTIPLKYYGFVKPIGRALDGSRGFFMDGENILVGGEGDILEKHFLIVALTPNTARLEDTQAKQGQELQVTPEAQPSQ